MKQWGLTMININEDKALEITKEAIRANRKPKLEALDVEFQKALETNADTTEIVAKKQELRDSTNISGTVEELKVIIDNLAE